MLPRLFAILMVVLGIFLFPWWLWALLVVVCMVRFPRFLAGPVAALLFDLVYAATPIGFLPPGSVTGIAVILYICIALVRSHLRHDVLAYSA